MATHAHFLIHGRWAEPTLSQYLDWSVEFLRRICARVTLHPSDDHPPVPQIAAYVLGRLPEHEATSVEEHLAACEDCARLVCALPVDPFLTAFRKAARAAASPDTMTYDNDDPFRTTASAAEAPEPQSAPPVPPGFEILGELGRGGMGVVYKARQIALNRVVAIKVVLAGGHANAQHRARFVREAETAAGIGHSHVVHVYETGTWAGQPYLVLEYCPGGTLADQLRGGPLTTERTAALIETLARAVQAAHDHGVVHRDLKPQNVLLSADGTPKVADFGLAKMVDSNDGLTATGVVMGTPSYMAPEQAAGRREVGPEADIYALGAILYECLTGRPPFRGPTAMDIIVQVLEREPEEPRTINPSADSELAAVALKCLEKAPGDRYPSAAALAEDVARSRRGEPVLAPKRRGARRIIAWARREPGLAVRLAVLSIGAVVIDFRYRLDKALEANQHFAILSILLAWALTSLACQALFRREIRPGLISLVWLGSDAIFLTAALACNRGQDSPLVVLYGLIVVSSGLWLRAEFVRFTTVAAVVGYVTLVGRAAYRGELQSAPLHHVIAVVALIAAGESVAYQVRRVRMLGRYFGNDRTGRSEQ